MLPVAAPGVVVIKEDVADVEDSPTWSEATLFFGILNPARPEATRVDFIAVRPVSMPALGACCWVSVSRRILSATLAYSSVGLFNQNHIRSVLL